MFAWWGRTVYRYRYIVIGVMVALCLGGGVFGMSLGQHVTQSGFYDDGSESAQASRLADEVYGRDTSGHIIAIYTAPEGKTVDDPAFKKKILDNLAQVERTTPTRSCARSATSRAPRRWRTWPTPTTARVHVDPAQGRQRRHHPEQLQEGPARLRHRRRRRQTGRSAAMANELTGTIGEDQKRGEVLAIPLVAVVLFFVFGGVVAASLPAIVGGLTIAGALGSCGFSPR